MRVEQTTNAPLTACSAEVREDTGGPLLRSEIDYTLSYGGQNIAFNSVSRRRDRVEPCRRSTCCDSDWTQQAIGRSRAFTVCLRIV